MFSAKIVLTLVTASSATLGNSLPCSSSLPNWSAVQRVPGQTDEHPVNVVSIDSDGTLRWNGRAVTAALVRQFVAIIPKMKPGNITVLKSDGKAPCAVVAETRRVIDDALGCRPETCAEVVAERGTD